MLQDFRKRVAAAVGLATVAAIAMFMTGCGLVGLARLMSAPPGTVPVPTQGERDLLSDVADPASTLGGGSIPVNIVPRGAGAGLVVGSPTGAGVSADAQSFGDACSLWLQIVSAGQPGLGKTPSPAGLSRAAIELPSPNLRLTANDLPRLPMILGVTHAVIGTMSIRADSYTLTYQVYAAKSGWPVGGAITLSGSENGILQQLPQAAAQISRNLGIPAPNAPSSVGCSAEDMTYFGRTWWARTTVDADNTRLAALAPHSGLAAFVSIDKRCFYSPIESQAAVDQTLSAFPENPYVYRLTAADYPSLLEKYQTNLTRDVAAYPANYLYAASLAYLYNYQPAPALRAVNAAVQAVDNAPNDPDAWLMLAEMYSDQANAIRQGRYWNDLTQSEQDQLNAPYAYWLGCSEHAAALDPLDMHCWIQTAMSAQMSGRDTEADAAIRHAIHMPGDPHAAYAWALQMYQPQWRGRAAAKLQAAAILAANDPAVSADELIDLGESVDQATYADYRQLLLDAAASRLRQSIAANPSDADACEMLGKYYDDCGDGADAQINYERAAAADPRNPDFENALGQFLYDHEQFVAALDPYLAAERVEPAYPNIHYLIGLVYKREGKYDLALAQMHEELRIYRNSPTAYSGMGDVYSKSNQPAKAAAEFSVACHLRPLNALDWESAANNFDFAGDIKDALLTIQQEKAYYPVDPTMEITQQDCYLKLHRPDVTIQLCNALLSTRPYPTIAADSHENLGEAYLAENNLVRARAEWKIAAAANDARVADVAQAFLNKYGG
jgi:Tfp pilus assembly protein PilF